MRAEKVCGCQSATLAYKNLEQFRRTLGRAFDLKVAPAATSPKRLGKHEQLARNRSTKAAPCLATPTSGD
jgi:hypothetical protein